MSDKRLESPAEAGSVEEQLAGYREALRETVRLAKNLHGMIPRQVWRDQGGDDGQGHYEGDYWAEQAWLALDEMGALIPEDSSESDVQKGVV